MHSLESINQITGRILGICFQVHTTLGPGLLESSYKEAIFYELTKAEIMTEKEKPLPLIYKDIRLDIGYRLDIIVEHAVVLEIKAVEKLTDVHKAQLLTYLKLTGCKVGLLINFNVADLKKGIKRLIL